MVRKVPRKRKASTVKVTIPGRILFWGLIISALLGGYTTGIKIYYIFCAILSLFIVSMIVSHMVRPRLELFRTISTRTTAGHNLSCYLNLTNRSRFPCFFLQLRERDLPPEIGAAHDPASFIQFLRPGENRESRVTLHFKKRGAYILQGIVAESYFPFGIIAADSFVKDEVTILVYPRFNPLVGLEIPTGTRYQPGGLALTSSVGESTEFIGNREYRQGDSKRFIHWRSWARLCRPVVKEFQEEYFCRIALILDTHIPEATPAHRALSESFESAVSMAASVADYIARLEYVIDVLVAGPDVYYLQAGRSLAYLENILDLLACVEPCSDNPFERIAPILLDRLQLITTAVLILLDWDESRSQFVRLIRDLGTEVKVILVRDGKPTQDPGLSEFFTGKSAVITPEEERKGVEEL